MTKPIIDMWAPILPTPEMLAEGSERFPHEMLGYLRVFFKLEANPEGVERLMKRVEMPEDLVFEAIAASGITQSLVTGFDELSAVGKTFMPNDRVAAVYERRPEQVIPFAGIDVLSGMAGVRATQHWIAERGFHGVSLRPFMIGLPPDDRRYYPVYAKCAELGVPVSIHASANWTTVRSSELGHPRHIDTVACDFPELTIIMSHAGYPWVLEAVQTAWKHPNVYLELAAHRPKYFGLPGTGWEPLLRFGTTTIQDKVLFGTGWFLLGRPPEMLVREFGDLPIPPAILDKWLGGNAARLFAGTRARLAAA